MKRFFILILIISACIITTNAQTPEVVTKLKTPTTDTIEGWKEGGEFFLNFSQTSLTNWAAGGESSIALNGIISVFANYKKGNLWWENSLDMGYGKMKQDGEDFVKTDDKIDLLSKYGRKAFNKVYYSALINFKTQMDNGYNYPNDSVVISKFLAPAYILGAIGLDYKPNDYMGVFLSPATAKITLVNDQVLADSGAFGVERGEKSRIELGGYFRFSFKKELFENVTFNTKLDLFTNYLKNPECIDVNWETLITLKVNKYISASISTTLIYDDDILIGKDSNDDDIITPDEMSPRTQFKEVLAVGFTYKF